MTFAELLQKVRDYTEVDSNVLTDSILDSMIRDAELRIFREVDADYAREYATANVNINSPYLQLPNATSSSGLTSTRRAVIVRSFLVFNTNESPTNKEYLDKRDTSFIFEYNSTGATGVPKYYAYWDEDPNHIVVAPAPSSAFTAQINYIKTPQHLSASNTTTWLSTYAQNLLFYGVMTEAFGYLKGPVDMYNTYKNRYTEELKTFGIFQKGYRRRDDYTDGVTQIKL